MSALLQVIDLSFSRSDTPLFEALNLTINKHDKIGLIGYNGVGKSTLLELIRGNLTLDAGEIRIPNRIQVGLVEQFVPKSLLSQRLIDAVVDVLPLEEQDTQVWRAERQLSNLGFSPAQAQLSVDRLSGGQQNLMLIARVMLLDPDVLLMDEPGNHMDISAQTQLAHYLKFDCGCPFLMISHDQHLLDKVCTKTIFIRSKKAFQYELPFSQARVRMKEEDESDEHRKAIEEKEIDRLKSTAKRLAIWGREHDNESLSRKAKTIEKRADKLDAEKTEVRDHSPLRLTLSSERLDAKQILSLENVNIETPDGARMLLHIDECLIRPGDRIALLGINGVGKSTTLERVIKAYQNENSEIRFNPRAELAYYDQGLRSLEQPLSRLDWLRQHTTSNEDELKHGLLSAGISYHDFSRKVNTLSGGEKSRLVFLAFSLLKPNFLVLDEPTNHIDLDGRRQLAETLIDSKATLLMTSHDRHFLDEVATRWLLIQEGRLLEINDPKEFYDRLSQSLPDSSKTSPVVEESGKAIDFDEAEALHRIDILERKLAEDQQRKPKFQKPHLHEQWQQELDSLWQSLEL